MKRVFEEGGIGRNIYSYRRGGTLGLIHILNVHCETP